MAEGGVTRSLSSPDRAIVSGPFLAVDPHALFQAWTEPALLVQWWPPVAEIDAREGGAYHLAWPSMNWHLRGAYLAIEQDRLLRFTWKWDHTALPERIVEVRFEPLRDGGTRLTVEHGRYDDTPEDIEDRESHVAGWLHFLGRLYMLSPEMSAR
jgi:uncharacterized protein YndB with AHSA1/START domain